MKRGASFQTYQLTVLFVLAWVALVIGCSPAAMKAPDAAPAEAEAPPAPTEAPPAPAEAEQVVAVPATPPAQPTASSGDTGAAPLAVAYQANRLIIKNAELSLRVADTDRAIDQVTQVATDNFGYILSSRTWYENDFKYATITLGVPSEGFENTLRRLRGLALKVLDENASGTDVTDEYVDLESRLRNLEATEARVRSFLDQAKTVEEALKVSEQLAEITAEIEQVKGRMNYLKDRAAYSTITVHLSPEVPTPTPTPTATVTPSPTPIRWQPNETLQSATGVLGSILRALGNLLIWIIVVLGPFVILAALILWLGLLVWRRRRK